MSESRKTGTARLRALGQAIGLLTAAEVDYEEPEQERAYYLVAVAVIDAIIETPATDLASLQVKAEAVAWCAASRTEFGFGETLGEQLMASILRDLLLPP